jgi:Tfp pilus assembly protein PilE
MFKKLLKNKKAQQTAEYALLISLVVAAVIAMQTYAQRTIQARIRDAAAYMTDQTSQIGSTNQYEPYYLTTDYNVERDDNTTEIQSQKADGSGLFQMQTDSTRTRQTDGFQESSYNTAFGLINGI